jgi:hypothetical protein
VSAMLASTENRRKARMVRFLVSTEPFSAEGFTQKV